MGKIVFYEDRNFQGRSYECSGDVPELSSYLSRCGSCRVESGCFVLYDRPNFAGQQGFVRRGDYSDYQRIGLSGAIQSCRLVPQYRGAFRMRMYERENFAGQMRELLEDCESLQERFHLAELQSCQVEGHWLVCEQPHYRGRVWYLRPGDYRSWRDMAGGVANPTRLCSARRITEPC